VTKKEKKFYGTDTWGRSRDDSGDLLAPTSTTTFFFSTVNDCVCRTGLLLLLLLLLMLLLLLKILFVGKTVSGEMKPLHASCKNS
jgi:hypothetical protein